MPIDLEVSAFLLDLIAIDDVGRTFTADLAVEFRWRDAPRSVPEAERDSWRPAVAFVNERSIEDRLEPVIQVGPDGLRRVAYRFLGTFSTRLDLRDFPLDSQRLVFELAVLRTLPEEVRLVGLPERSGRQDQLGIVGWQVGDLGLAVGEAALGQTGIRLPSVEISVPVQRDRGYFLWKIIFPLTLIVLMASTVFWFPPSLIPSQVAIATASVLTLIAFYLTVSNSLPRISYLTRLDVFVIGSTALVFVTFGQALYTGSLAHRDQVAKAQRIDRLSRLAFFPVFALLFLLAFAL